MKTNTRYFGTQTEKEFNSLKEKGCAYLVVTDDPHGYSYGHYQVDKNQNLQKRVREIIGPDIGDIAFYSNSNEDDGIGWPEKKTIDTIFDLSKSFEEAELPKEEINKLLNT